MATMSAKDRDEQHMARLRKRAEIQPSDDEEEQASLGDDGGGGDISSADEESRNEDDWSEEEEAHGEAHVRGAKASTPDPTDGDQALPIGKRLEMLAHGNGPSRRRRPLQKTGTDGNYPAISRIDIVRDAIAAIGAIGDADIAFD